MVEHTFNVQVPTTTSVYVGKPYDPDGDKIFIEFSSGSQLISFNEKSGLLLIDPLIKEGSYSVTIKLEDIGAIYILTQKYNILLKISYPAPVQALAAN